MATDPLQAWLLHTKRGRGASMECHLLTQEQGLLRAYCQFGRQRQKRALLQPFTPLWLLLNTKHHGVYIEKLECRAAPLYLMGERMFAGLYINELLYHALKPHDPEPRLYALYESTLGALAEFTDRTQFERLLRIFEFKALAYLGYEISFLQQADTQGPIKADQCYRFDPKLGFFPHVEGFLGAHLLAIANHSYNDHSILKTAKHIARLAIDELLEGTPIKSRLLYTKSTIAAD